MPLRFAVIGCLVVLGLISKSQLALAFEDSESENRLTPAEEISGWQLLFDGQSAEHFRNYRKDSLGDGWVVQDGALTRAQRRAGDIITREKFRFFELSIEYNISSGGNSGIMFHVEEGVGPPWHTGPEVQILCNEAGRDPQKSGWLYQLFSPRKEGDEILDATRPAGQWNQIYLKVSPTGCEVCMNGVKYYNFNLNDKAWDRRVAESKFANLPNFGKTGEGHICLQDHGDLVSFRNIKIRPLEDDGSLPRTPAHGELNVTGELAFPNLQWEDYEPVDEDGNLDRQLRILEITYANGLPKRLFAVAQRGILYTFENDPEVEQASIFLDLRDRVSRWWVSGAENEQGLLGLAMHPDFVNNGQFFVCYTGLEDDHTRVSRFRVSEEDPLKADPDSEQILLHCEQPFKNHNGGAIEFGPDGMLYIALGDGGFRNDPHENGQDLSTLLGTILRIDVDRTDEGLAYAIPPDNPFVNVSGARGEIYAFGLRNPWRIAFDSETGRLWCGDVGQELWEEINVITAGGNYGWSNREGTKPFWNRDSHPDFPPIDPVWEYDHGVGKSITGGRVYRSESLPQLAGKYLYADYISGGVWALTFDESAGVAVRNEQIAAGGIPILAFGEDETGEIFYATDNGHARCIFKFVEK